jgi:hypothetical protein
MCLNGINSFERLNFTTDQQGLFSTAAHLPFDVLSCITSPFCAEDSDKIRLRGLAGSKLSEEDLNWVSDLLNSKKYPLLRKEMVALFEKMSPEEMETVISKGLSDALKKDGFEIPLERYFDTPWQQLIDNQEDLEKLHEYFSTLPPKEELESDLRPFEATWRFICYIIDIMITLTSVNYFLDDPGYQASSENSKPYMYGVMITNMTALYGLMFAIQGAALPAAGATAGAVFLLISAVKLYRTFLRPAEDMYPLINLNREVKRGFSKQHNIDGNVLDTIANNLRPKNPIFVTGPSGVGKTTHIHAFAEQVNAGKYPHLKGKQVYFINTPVLLDSGQKSYKSNSLTDILQHLHGREDEVVLFFDEAHAAWNDENKSLAEQFKWISDNFNVIFATTDEEYNKVQEDNSESFKALQRRHKKIEMSSQTDEQTLAIMRKRVEELFPELPLSNDSLEDFLSLTKSLHPDRAQPEASLKFMEECFGIIRSGPEVCPRIKQIKAEISLLQAHMEETPNLEDIKSLRSLEKELEELNIELAAEKAKHQLYLDLLKDRKALREAQGDMDLPHWMFMHSFLHGSLDRRIQELATEVFKCEGIHPMNHDFIKAVLIDSL